MKPEICPHPFCNREVAAPAFLCSHHMQMVPQSLVDQIDQAYRMMLPPDGDLEAGSRLFRKAFGEAIDIILAREGFAPLSRGKR